MFQLIHRKPFVLLLLYVHKFSHVGSTRRRKDSRNRFLLPGRFEIGEVNLNPLGQGGDFVAFPVVGDVGYVLEHATDFSGVRTDIRNFRSPENKLASVTLDAKLLNGAKKCYVQNPTASAAGASAVAADFLERRVRVAFLAAVLAMFSL